MNWIVGTLILWVLKAITVPFAKMLAGKSVPTELPSISPAPSTETATPAETGPQPAPMKPKSAEDEIPTGYYILADVIVLGMAGLLLGGLTGYYFIGFSWRAKDWPGMIVFIIASFLGSALHG